MGQQEPEEHTTGRAAWNPLRAIVRLSGLLFLSAIIVARYRLRLLLAWRDPAARLAITGDYSLLWGRTLCWVLGIRLTVRGNAPPPGSFVVANHIGYCDIPVLAAATRCVFVPKSEVYGWPLIGAVLRMIDVPVVDRGVARSLGPAAQQTERFLLAGMPVVIFVEGTSTGGDRVLPFHSPFFQAAVTVGAPVQPVAVRWSTPADPRIDLAEEVAYWRPEHTFGPHIWRFAGLRGTVAEVEFLEPIAGDQGLNRKQLAAEAHARVSAALGFAGATK